MTGGGWVLELPAQADSPARARRFLREVLTGPAAGLGEDLLDDAAVCVTELVSNALLHARTAMTLTARRTGDGLRLAVVDGSPRRPHWVPRSLTAGTGRGLALISALSADHGVEPHPGGKEVWCELRPGAGGPADPAELAGELAQEWAAVVAELGDVVGTDPAPGPPLRLLRYPVEVGIRMREHRETVLRELQLLGLPGGNRDADAVGATAQEVRQLLDAVYGGPLSRAEADKLRAAAEGRAEVDLEYDRFPDQRSFVERWRRLVAEVEELGRARDVAVLATPGDVSALERWVCEEFLRQLDGEGPRPWPHVPA
ncbi:ATP-binding protein [Kineococcus terrestris]|uniref:ATP-binding protein n=1 Tax=Kineococcus terrestris TaxID=2044856 RepID=UPI0034DB2B7F